MDRFDHQKGSLAMADILEFPSCYMDLELQQARQVIANARLQTMSYSGDFTDFWLDSDVLAPVWKLTTDDPHVRVRKANTRLAQTFDWRIGLPDGSLLTDDANAFMFEGVAKSCFLIRSLPHLGVSNNTALVSMCYSVVNVTRWMYRHVSRYQPATNAFSRLNTSAVLSFLALAGEGGMPWVMGYPQSLLNYWYQKALGKKVPKSVLSDPFTVPAEDRQGIIAWLKTNDYYRATLGGRGGFLDRRKIAAILGCNVQHIKAHPQFSALLRCFEPDATSSLLIGRETRREFPSHKTQLLSDAQSLGMDSSAKRYANVFGTLFRLRHHLPAFIPDTTTIDFAKITRAATENSAPPGHTPWIPLKLALSYTNEALRWVHLYGDDLVDLYLKTIRTLRSEGLLEGATGHKQNVHRRRNATAAAIPKPTSLEPLNIDGWQSKLIFDCTAYDDLRQRPGLNDALAVLIGAVLVLFSFLKPVRQSEIQSLRRDAVRFVKGDGYWVGQKLAKARLAGSQLDIERPIPRVVAKALLLMDKLCTGLRKLTGEDTSDKSAKLFQLPDRDFAEVFILSEMTSMRMNGYLDRFCDYVDAPVDENGRRWYLRIHEARKSFIITFFWCFRFSSLEAARWIAGHTNAQDIYAYIQANFPGHELPALEADYSAMQLWEFERTGNKGEADNVKDLYKAVCRHFKVHSVSILPEEELLEWLELAFQRGIYKIEPYSTKSSTDVLNVNICFRITPESV